MINIIVLYAQIAKGRPSGAAGIMSLVQHALALPLCVDLLQFYICGHAIVLLKAQNIC
jgi:hypothetical protein